MNESYKIRCKDVWKLFGPQEARTFASLDKSASRAAVQEKTGHVIAVKDVSFDVREGETFVVMGLSGSGKSTLVRCISRLIEPTAGSVIIDGSDVTSMSRRQLIELRRHKMSMVFQHFGLFAHRRVIDNIAYGLEVRGMGKKARIEKAMEVLELVGLGGWENNYPRELSGGMQQRVGLARAMAVDPEILIFDEPFSALDPLIRREMQDELIKIQQMVKKTMIFITHDFLEAIKMGDHIAIMKDGEIAQIGTPEEIIAEPADDYVREFTEDVPRYKVLSAAKVMRSAGSHLNHDSSIEVARAQMRDGRASVSFVTDNNGKFLGTVRAADLVDAAGDLAAVMKVMNMNTQIRSVQSDTKLDDLIHDALDHDNPLPVVNAAGKLIGEIDRSIIMRAMSTRTQPSVASGTSA